MANLGTHDGRAVARPKNSGSEGCTRPPEPYRTDRSARVPVSLVNDSCQRSDL